MASSSLAILVIDENRIHASVPADGFSALAMAIVPDRVKLRPTDQAGSRWRGWNRLKADVNSPTKGR
jgi:hypothetical protein